MVGGPVEKRPRRFSSGMLCLFAGLLLAAAAVFGVLAYTCMGTSQYTHYAEHISEWREKATAEQALADTSKESGQDTNALMHQDAANDWLETVNDAKSYLTLHQAGAAALALVCLFCIAIAIWLFRSASRQKKIPAELPPPGPQPGI